MKTARIRKYEARLWKLIPHLHPAKTARSRTAAALAKRLRVSRPTVYTWIFDLQDRLGLLVQEEPIRYGKRGPLSIAWRAR